MRPDRGPEDAASASMKTYAAAVIAAITLLGGHGASAASQTYRIDPAKSRVTIHVDKSGAFSFLAGHTHLVVGPVASGSIEVDADAPTQSRVRLMFPTGKLKVSAEGEPEGDAPKV